MQVQVCQCQRNGTCSLWILGQMFCQPVELAVMTIAKCIKNRVDRSFIDEREVQTGKAIAKLNCFLDINLECSGFGRQLEKEVSEEGRRDVLLAILGTRSPSTVVKRINALLHFYRWHCAEYESEFMPIKKTDARTRETSTTAKGSAHKGNVHDSSPSFCSSCLASGWFGFMHY